jgi:hypothetical protein
VNFPIFNPTPGEAILYGLYAILPMQGLVLGVAFAYARARGDASWKEGFPPAFGFPMTGGELWWRVGAFLLLAFLPLVASGLLFAKTADFCMHGDADILCGVKLLTFPKNWSVPGVWKWKFEGVAVEPDVYVALLPIPWIGVVLLIGNLLLFLFALSSVAWPRARTRRRHP